MPSKKSPQKQHTPQAAAAASPSASSSAVTPPATKRARSVPRSGGGGGCADNNGDNTQVLGNHHNAGGAEGQRSTVSPVAGSIAKGKASNGSTAASAACDAMLAAAAPQEKEDAPHAATDSNRTAMEMVKSKAAAPPSSTTDNTSSSAAMAAASSPVVEVPFFCALCLGTAVRNPVVIHSGAVPGAAYGVSSSGEHGGDGLRMASPAAVEPPSKAPSKSTAKGGNAKKATPPPQAPQASVLPNGAVSSSSSSSLVIPSACVACESCAMRWSSQHIREQCAEALRQREIARAMSAAARAQQKRQRQQQEEEAEGTRLLDGSSSPRSYCPPPNQANEADENDNAVNNGECREAVVDWSSTTAIEVPATADGSIMVRLEKKSRFGGSRNAETDDIEDADEEKEAGRTLVKVTVCGVECPVCSEASRCVCVSKIVSLPSSSSSATIDAVLRMAVTDIATSTNGEKRQEEHEEEGFPLLNVWRDSVRSHFNTCTGEVINNNTSGKGAHHLTTSPFGEGSSAMLKSATASAMLAGASSATAAPPPPSTKSSNKAKGSKANTSTADANTPRIDGAASLLDPSLTPKEAVVLNWFTGVPDASSFSSSANGLVIVPFPSSSLSNNTTDSTTAPQQCCAFMPLCSSPMKQRVLVATATASASASNAMMTAAARFTSPMSPSTTAANSALLSRKPSSLLVGGAILKLNADNNAGGDEATATTTATSEHTNKPQHDGHNLPLCGACEEEGGTVDCVECGFPLCDGCLQSSHSKGRYKTHTIVPIGHASRTKGRKCPEHSDQTLELYCNDCRVCVCVRCCFNSGGGGNHGGVSVSGLSDFGRSSSSSVSANQNNFSLMNGNLPHNHSGHNVVPLKEVVSAIAAAVEQSSASMRVWQRRAQKASALLRQYVPAIDCRQRSVESTIRNHFDALRTALAQSEKEAVADVHAYLDSQRSNLLSTAKAYAEAAAEAHRLRDAMAVITEQTHPTVAVQLQTSIMRRVEACTRAVARVGEVAVMAGSSTTSNTTAIGGIPNALENANTNPSATSSNSALLSDPIAAHAFSAIITRPHCDGEESSEEEDDEDEETANDADDADAISNKEAEDDDCVDNGDDYAAQSAAAKKANRLLASSSSRLRVLLAPLLPDLSGLVFESVGSINKTNALSASASQNDGTSSISSQQQPSNPMLQAAIKASFGLRYPQLPIVTATQQFAFSSDVGNTNDDDGFHKHMDTPTAASSSSSDDHRAKQLFKAFYDSLKEAFFATTMMGGGGGDGNGNGGDDAHGAGEGMAASPLPNTKPAELSLSPRDARNNFTHSPLRISMTAAGNDGQPATTGAYSNNNNEAAHNHHHHHHHHHNPNNDSVLLLPDGSTAGSGQTPPPPPPPPPPQQQLDHHHHHQQEQFNQHELKEKERAAVAAAAAAAAAEQRQLQREQLRMQLEALERQEEAVEKKQKEHQQQLEHHAKPINNGGNFSNTSPTSATAAASVAVSSLHIGGSTLNQQQQQQSHTASSDEDRHHAVAATISRSKGGNIAATATAASSSSSRAKPSSAPPSSSTNRFLMQDDDDDDDASIGLMVGNYTNNASNQHSGNNNSGGGGGGTRKSGATVSPTRGSTSRQSAQQQQQHVAGGGNGAAGGGFMQSSARASGGARRSTSTLGGIARIFQMNTTSTAARASEQQQGGGGAASAATSRPSGRSPARGSNASPAPPPASTTTPTTKGPTAGGIQLHL